MLEAREFHPKPAEPVIEYRYRGYSSSPYLININAPELGNLLRTEFAMNDAEIAKTKFTLSDKLEIRQDFTERSAEGAINGTVSHSLGQTKGVRNPDGTRQIDIHMGSIEAGMEGLKDTALLYCVMSKADNLPPSMQNKLKFQELPLVLTFDSNRIIDYLRAADPNRAERFIENLIKHRTPKMTVETLVHEASHAKDFNDAEPHMKGFQRSKKIGGRSFKVALVGLGALIGGDIAGVLPFTYDAALTGATAALLLFARFYSGRELAQKGKFIEILKDTEARAQEKEKAVDIDKWMKIIELVPNPDYKFGAI